MHNTQRYSHVLQTGVLLDSQSIMHCLKQMWYHYILQEITVWLDVLDQESVHNTLRYVVNKIAIFDTSFSYTI